MLKRGWLVGVILGCVACAAGGATGPEATTNPVVAAAIEPPVGNDLVRGEWVYARFCATCHGDKGDGRGPTADRYDAPLPRDFTKGKFEYRTTEGGQLPLRKDLMRTIQRGIPDTMMPAWGHVLPPSDVEAVAAYVETFSPRFAAEPEANRVVVNVPPEPPGFSASQIETGRLFFIAFRCWECHGTRAEGNGPLAGTLKTDWKVPIRPADLTRRKHHSGPSATDLYRTIATGLEGTPMPMFKRTAAVGREGLSDLGEHVKDLDPADVTAVRNLLAKLPSQAEIDRSPDNVLDKMVEVRLWLLVGYVRSLQRSATPIDWLLLDDPQEETTRAEDR